MLRSRRWDRQMDGRFYEDSIAAKAAFAQRIRDIAVQDRVVVHCSNFEKGTSVTMYKHTETYFVVGHGTDSDTLHEFTTYGSAIIQFCGLVRAYG